MGCAAEWNAPFLVTELVEVPNTDVGTEQRTKAKKRAIDDSPKKIIFLNFE